MVVGVELQLVVLAPRYKNINRRTPNLAAHAQPKDVSRSSHGDRKPEGRIEDRVGGVSTFCQLIGHASIMTPVDHPTALSPSADTSS
jgi:hypothetical protein